MTKVLLDTDTTAIDTLIDANSNVSTNTTHRSSSGSDHSDVVINTTHRGLTNDPHNVTATQVGLGNVTDDAQLPLTGGTMTGLLNINHPSTTTTDTIFSVNSNIADVKTELFARGTQRWDFTDGGGVYKGSIQYSTPGGNPGIIMRGATEVGRTDIGMNSQTGGFSIGTGVNNSNPPTQFLIEADNNVSVPLGDFTVTTGNVAIGKTNPLKKLEVNGDVLFEPGSVSSILFDEAEFYGGALKIPRITGVGDDQGLVLKGGLYVSPQVAATYTQMMLVNEDISKFAKILFDHATEKLIFSDTLGYAFGANVDITGNISVTGTVDGIDIATDVAANTAKVSFTKTNIKGTINHGATAGTTRPTDFDSVEWIGSVEPTNATNDDTWIDTT